jgi:hypothetical protein
VVVTVKTVPGFVFPERSVLPSTTGNVTPSGIGPNSATAWPFKLSARTEVLTIRRPTAQQRLIHRRKHDL